MGSEEEYSDPNTAEVIAALLRKNRIRQHADTNYTLRMRWGDDVELVFEVDDRPWKMARELHRQGKEGVLILETEDGTTLVEEDVRGGNDIERERGASPDKDLLSLLQKGESLNMSASVRKFLGSKFLGIDSVSMCTFFCW